MRRQQTHSSNSLLAHYFVAFKTWMTTSHKLYKPPYHAHYGDLVCALPTIERPKGRVKSLETDWLPTYPCMTNYPLPPKPTNREARLVGHASIPPYEDACRTTNKMLKDKHNTYGTI